MNVLKIARYSKFCVLLKTTTRGHSFSNLYASKYFWFLQVEKICVGYALADIPLPLRGIFMLLSVYDTVFYFLCFLPFWFELHRLLINDFRRLNNRTIFLVNGFLSCWNLSLSVSNKASGSLCVSPRDSLRRRKVKSISTKSLSWQVSQRFPKDFSSSMQTNSDQTTWR